MKLECTILAAEDAGDELLVRMQGRPPRSPDWRGMRLQELRIPLTEATRKSYYVGRRVIVTVEPK